MLTKDKGWCQDPELKVFHTCIRTTTTTNNDFLSGITQVERALQYPPKTVSNPSDNDDWIKLSVTMKVMIIINYILLQPYFILPCQPYFAYISS